MLQQVQSYAARIVMGVACYLFGFFVMANALDLGDREIVIGLIAGLIGGVTMLVTAIRMSDARCRMSDVRCQTSDITPLASQL